MKMTISDEWKRWRPYVYSETLGRIRGRYANTLLGPLWVLILPATLVFIYSVVFSQLISVRISDIHPGWIYGVFLCAGMLLWILFSDLIIKATTLLTGHAHILKKTAVPVWVLIFINTLISLFDLMVFFVVFLVFLIIVDHFPEWYILLSFIGLVMLVIFLSLGVGMMLSVIQVYFRDTAHFLNVALQVGFWGTPVVYPLDIVPEWARRIIEINPMTPVVQTSQNLFVSGQVVWSEGLLWTLSVALVCALMAWRAYRIQGRDLVDAL